MEKFDDQVNMFGCRRCGNKDTDKIEPIVTLVGTKKSGLIGHAKIPQYRFDGYRCLVCTPKAPKLRRAV